jgi:hypothetical protein
MGDCREKSRSVVTYNYLIEISVMMNKSGLDAVPSSVVLITVFNKLENSLQKLLL